MLLNDELERMRGLGDDVYDRCGCVLKNTHQIPCACELRRAIVEKTPIRLDQIHIFWRRLEIGVGQDRLDPVPSTDISEDHRYLSTLVHELNQSDPAVVRNIALLINDQLHPEQRSFCEPEERTNPRGRPRGSTSTRREPSRWEYSLRGRGHGRSSSSSTSRGRSSSSSVHNASTTGTYEYKLRFFI